MKKEGIGKRGEREREIERERESCVEFLCV